MSARRTLAVAIMLVLASGGLAALTVLRRVDTVSVADAVERYRASAPASAPAPTTTVVTTGAATIAGPAGVAGSDAATTGGGAGAAGGGAVAAGARIPSGTPSATPPPGVYVYRTSGFEEIGIPGGRRAYPAETTMTVRPSGCGADVRWDVFEERWDLWNTCTAGTAVDLAAFTTFHEFFGQVEQRRYDCEPHTSLRPPTAEPTTGRCVDGTAAVELTATVVGTEDVEIGGARVTAVRVRLDEVLTGHTAGTRTSDSWYRAGDGLLLRRTAVTDVESETVFGHTSYDEELEVELTRLEPLR